MSRQTVEFDQLVAELPATDEPDEPTLHAEVVVKGRNVEIPDHFRIYVSQKLARLERFDRTIYLFDVELDHERNRRQRKSCQHVEITARGRGPVVRGEACANSFYAAFESAVAKLEAGCVASRIAAKSTTATRPRSHWPPRPPSCPPEPAFETETNGAADHEGADGHHEPGRVVRTKEHPAKPMSVDDALYEMELVGHDFFLFYDKQTERPSVVYRRHAYDYGLIRLA